MSSLALPAKVDPFQKFIGVSVSLGGLSSKRKQYQFSQNETMSTADVVFKDVIRTKSPEELSLLTDETMFIKRYDEVIREHIHRRVAVFFQQLVVSYGTQLHLEIGATCHQGQSAKSLKIEGPDGRVVKKVVRNAAHSSTIPCLLAYDGRKWKLYEEDLSIKPEGFVYIKGADIYRSANSTLELPRAVNEADIEIDGKKDDSTLRSYSIRLLNKASSAELDPKEGIQRFLRAIRRIVEQRKDVAKKEGVRAALHIFSDELIAIENDIDSSPEILDQLLGVRTDGSDGAARARETVHRLRYRAIQENQFAQSRILHQVDLLGKTILGKLGRKTQPTYFEPVFRQVLREALETKVAQRRFDKLINSPQGSGLTKRQKTVRQVTRERISPYLDEISTFARQLRSDFYQIKREETLLRGRTTKVLRDSRGWRQKDLAEEIKKLYPETVASQATISRVENNIKLVSPSYAREISAVFEVDPALFLPSFFSE